MPRTTATTRASTSPVADLAEIALEALAEPDRHPPPLADTAPHSRCTSSSTFAFQLCLMTSFASGSPVCLNRDRQRGNKIHHVLDALEVDLVT